VQLIRLLQLTDSFFPVGAFAYSDGLETATSNGTVSDAASLKLWLDHFLDNVFVPCDGLALLKCSRAMSRRDYETIRQIDEELTAIRPAASVRNSSQSIGKRLLIAYSGICPDRDFSNLADTLPYSN